MDRPSVALDFDGTIVHSTDELLIALEICLKEFGVTLHSEARTLLGKHGWKALIRQHVEEHRIQTVIETICTAICQVREKIVVIDGMEEVLRELRERCNTLAIVTANAAQNVRTILHPDLIELFDLIHGRETDTKANLLRMITSTRNLDPRKMYYIGDEKKDIRVAEEAGINSIGVLWGANTRDVIESAHPHFIVSHPREILEIIKQEA